MHLITLTLFIAFSVLQLAHAQSLNSTRVITADSKDIDTIGDLITEECLQENHQTCFAFTECCKAKCPQRYEFRTYHCKHRGTFLSRNGRCFCDTRSDHSFLIIAFIVGLTALICLISVGVCVYCLWHNSGIPAAYRVISKRIRSYKGRGSPKIVPVYGLPTVSKMGQENRM